MKVIVKKCSKCKELKDFTFFNKGKSYKDGYRPSCKQCDKSSIDKSRRKKYKRRYYLENKEKLNKMSRNYYNENKESIKLYHICYSKKYYQENKDRINKRNANRRKTDYMYMLRRDLSTYTSRAFRNKGYSKNGRIKEILGADYQTIKSHIENQFTKDMNWDNRSEWHIDHIIPLSSANTEEELIKLCHYTNLQPLWAEDNIRKGGVLSK